MSVSLNLLYCHGYSAISKSSNCEECAAFFYFLVPTISISKAIQSLQKCFWLIMLVDSELVHYPSLRYFFSKLNGFSIFLRISMACFAKLLSTGIRWKCPLLYGIIRTCWHCKLRLHMPGEELHLYSCLSLVRLKQYEQEKQDQNQVDLFIGLTTAQIKELHQQQVQ